MPLQKVEELTDEELRNALWRSGNLSWKLDGHQLLIYDQYREWEKRDPGDDKAKGSYRRIFVLDISRRWGKTTLVLIIKIEDCLKQPNSIHTYATAQAKDIGEIILPILDDLQEDAPSDCAGQYRTTHEGRSQGIYFP